MTVRPSLCVRRFEDYTRRQNFIEKYNKVLTKMHKHLVQQIVQQKVYDNSIIMLHF